MRSFVRQKLTSKCIIVSMCLLLLEDGLKKKKVFIWKVNNLKKKEKKNKLKKTKKTKNKTKQKQNKKTTVIWPFIAANKDRISDCQSIRKKQKQILHTFIFWFLIINMEIISVFVQLTWELLKPFVLRLLYSNWTQKYLFR